MKLKEFGGTNADFTLVELKEQPKGVVTPHCKKHGAMNKLNDYLWRCMSTYKMNEAGGFGGTNCHACCVEEEKDDQT